MYGPIEKLISSQLQDSHYKINHLEKIIKHLQLQVSITTSILENTKHTRNTLNQQHKLLKDGVDTILKSTNEDIHADMNKNTINNTEFGEDAYLEETINRIETSATDNMNLMLSGPLNPTNPNDEEKELGTDDEHKGDSDIEHTYKEELSPELSPDLLVSQTPTRPQPSIKCRHHAVKKSTKRKLERDRESETDFENASSSCSSSSTWNKKFNTIDNVNTNNKSTRARKKQTLDLLFGSSFN